MSYLRVFFIAIMVCAAQIFSAEYDDQKTLLLEQYLSSKVEKFEETGEYPDRAELEERIVLLVNEGASLHAKHKYGSGTCALHFAAEAGSIYLVQFLISRNAELNIVDKTGRTPLHFACRRGHKALVHWLLLALADIEATNSDGYTPLMIAVIHNDTSIVRELLDYGAKTNVEGYSSLATPLNIAFSNRNEEIILALLAQDAEPLRKNFNLIEAARDVYEWQIPHQSGALVESFFDRIYAFPEQHYLKILNSCSVLFSELPKDLKLYIIRFVLAPWTVEKK